MKSLGEFLILTAIMLALMTSCDEVHASYDAPSSTHVNKLNK